MNTSNQKLEQFAYVASHDLKELIRKINSFGERLTVSSGDNLQEENKFYLTRMLDATGRMKVLIDNLLSYSRASQKTGTFIPVNLSQLVQRVLEDVTLKIQENKAIVKIGSLPVIEGIPTQMQQLFQNLISNSLKFCQTGLPTEIDIKACKASFDELKGYRLNQTIAYYKISIKDNGIGFQPNFAEKIFGLFQRLNGRSEYEGSGLGLSIAKRIVENHNGLIIARGVPDKGAEFTIYLPEKHH